MASIERNITANNDPDNYYRTVIYAGMNKAYFTAAKKQMYKRRAQTARANRGARITSTFSEKESEFTRQMALDVQPEITISSTIIESQAPLLIQSDEVPMFPLRIAGGEIHTKEQLQSFKVDVLRSILRQRGLQTSGRKDELIDRIMERQLRLT